MWEMVYGQLHGSTALLKLHERPLKTDFKKYRYLRTMKKLETNQLF